MGFFFFLENFFPATGARGIRAPGWRHRLKWTALLAAWASPKKLCSEAAPGELTPTSRPARPACFQAVIFVLIHPWYRTEGLDMRPAGAG